MVYITYNTILFEIVKKKKIRIFRKRENCVIYKKSVFFERTLNGSLNGFIKIKLKLKINKIKKKTNKK